MNFLHAPDDLGPGLRRWARLRADIPTVLRRGSWYPVLSVGAEEVVMEVRGSPSILARDAVEIVHTRPDAWGVVPVDQGGPYLVCPVCAERVRNSAVRGRFTCPRCHGSFAVALEQDIAS